MSGLRHVRDARFRRPARRLDFTMTAIPSDLYRSKRLATQIAVLLIFALVAALGLFKIDLAAATFSLFGRAIPWSDFAFNFGLGLLLVTAPVIIYLSVGTAWCGWACPQNTLSEWANRVTHRLLGKRASVDIDEDLLVAKAKNKALNWALLILIFLAASLLLALIPFLFFFSLDEAWGFVTQQSGSDHSAFILYCAIAFLVFIDIAVVRHFFCDYICPYRLGRHIFRNSEPFHIAYDASRAAACSKCHYCAATCVTNIEPTRITPHDRCINCGVCVDACDRLQRKVGASGLLKFAFASARGWRGQLKGAFSRMNWLVGGIFVLGIGMTAWGAATSHQEGPHVATAQERHDQQATALCQQRCTPQLGSCKRGQMTDCYAAAACQCQCRLDLDPASASRGEWQQCVQNSRANAAAATANKASGDRPIGERRAPRE
jgi:polyferredoxin